MLSRQIQQIVNSDPDYAAIAPVIEKEILHHDIMDALVRFGAMQSLTFIGGTSLRLCYNSPRLSEDLDFNGGYNFKPSDFDGLEVDIQDYIQNKYEIPVWVTKPAADKQGDTSSWKISIEKEANRPDLPRQKMHIDVCAIPSFDVNMRGLLNHYNMPVPTEGLLFPVQSLSETLADKLIALAYRSRRIKPRDLWDIVWIKQRGIELSRPLVDNKLDARGKEPSDFGQALWLQVEKLMHDGEVYNDFKAEIVRFVPHQIKVRTIDNPDYWIYVQSVVKELAIQALNPDSSVSRFDMSK